jgi:hypothetical protein
MENVTHLCPRERHRPGLLDRLRWIRTEAKRLERLWTRKLVRGGLEPWQVLSAEQWMERPLLELDRAAGVWRATAVPGLAFEGTASSCLALSFWGAPSRAVITAPLAALHELEDQLVELLGVPARRGRPLVQVAAPSNVRELRPAASRGHHPSSGRLVFGLPSAG